ncbi:hypothetical protein KC19_6G189100 [Ceratodon purpureus]|uniref:F-box domain-containing protein n=1 Tax=Ceratodon purpureus TaxID=3225 RepID=A0A8T0HJ50_CERPU|nr:hypothetical protein KC19_6G189100 [Ceratodon purpureus]
MASKVMASKDVEPGELDPRLWGNLPGEVLEAVFARMPTPAICRLRLLSRAWKRKASTYSPFTRLCAELQPSLYALLWRVYSKMPPWETAPYAARFYDASACKWMHPFPLGDVWNLDTAVGIKKAASDGGLVCFVIFPPYGKKYSTELPRPALVCNPLTGEWRELPLHSEEFEHLVRVEMRVDRRTGDYEIILVASSRHCYEEAGGPRCYGKVYSSRTNAWSGLDSRRVLLTDHFLKYDSYICDFTAQKFRPFDIRTVVSEDLDLLINHEVHWNNLYVVKKFSSEFAKDWMRNRDGSLVEDNYPDAELLSRYTLSIYEDGTWGFGDGGSAQGGSRAPVVYNLIGLKKWKTTWHWIFSRSFLMFICFPRYCDQYKQLMMIYDMEKGKWHKFDRSEGVTLSLHELHSFRLACELRWDARP